ncbi:aldehyde dehydrogenase family protein [Cupriavidus basilensis]
MNAAVGNFKKIALELGGKNPNIIFDDADFDTAVDYAVNAAFFHAGQGMCSGWIAPDAAGRYPRPLCRCAGRTRQTHPVSATALPKARRWARCNPHSNARRSST